VTATAAQGKSKRIGRTAFIGSADVADSVTGRVPLARLVMTGTAASADQRDLGCARSLLVAATAALRKRGLVVGILVTPAGFLEYKDRGKWIGTKGWLTDQSDFNRLAAIAADLVRDLVTPEARLLMLGAIDHLIIGVDVWPTEQSEPHAEVACLYNVADDAVAPITGKSYPNMQQENGLIRNPDIASHIAQIGDERVAVLVCHDLAAWSPRGNAVAKRSRAEAWAAMQAAVTTGRPTVAVQLPHTVSTPATWRSAWARFAGRSGGSLVSGTTAIRHLDQHWRRLAKPPDAALLAGTGRGARVVDVIITGTDE
jgi:hypothetical protein